MSTPTSFAQMVKAYEQLGEPSSEQLQWLLGSGLLSDLGVAAGPHLANVDRLAFRALITAPAPVVKPIVWGSAADYAAKLRDWNGQFRLGLSNQQIDELLAKLPDHAGPLQPTGITCTLGKGLKEDRKIVQRIIQYELGKLGVSYEDYLADTGLSYYPGSEQPKSRKPQLGVALLDIGTFWDPQNGVVVREARRQRDRWPGLEVDWLMALNPQVLAAIDYKTIPGFIAAGLVVGSERVPVFRRDAGKAYAGGRWDDGRWDGGSVVAFREC